MKTTARTCGRCPSLLRSFSGFNFAKHCTGRKYWISDPLFAFLWRRHFHLKFRSPSFAKNDIWRVERNCNKHNAAVFKPSWWWSCTCNCPTARANEIESPQPSHWLSQMLHAWIVSELTFGVNFKSRVVLKLGCWVHFKRLRNVAHGKFSPIQTL